MTILIIFDFGWLLSTVSKGRARHNKGISEKKEQAKYGAKQAFIPNKWRAI